MRQNVSLDLMEFIETEILPRYNAFGESHGLRHVTRVMRNSIELAKCTGADIDMVYTIAAYHDLGMSGPRAIHHITSGKILLYGRIVAEADRDLEPNEVFTRAIQYGLENYPNKNKDEQWERFRHHMKEKYSSSGYIKLWIEHSPNEKKLREIQNIIEEENRLKAIFNEIYDTLKQK